MSHADYDHKPQDENSELFGKLQRKAEELTKAKQNTISAGELHGEHPLAKVEVKGIQITRLPDDPLALRISIGEADLNYPSGYLVFRGEPGRIYSLLKRACDAFLESKI